MKIKVHHYIFFIMFILAFNSTGGGSQERKSEVKKQLKFNDWVGTSKDGLQYLFLSINFSDVLGDAMNCRCTLNSAGTGAYMIDCYTKGNSGMKPGFEDLSFTVTLFPDVAKARESVINLISASSAPLEKLEEQWRKENATFGDKAFGSELWCMGNAVIRLGNRDFDKTLVASVFSRFENYFRQKTVSREMDIFPLQGNAGDGNIRLDSLPDKSTVFITAPADYDLTVGEKNKTLKINKQPDKNVNMTDIHVNTIRSKEKTE